MDNYSGIGDNVTITAAATITAGEIITQGALAGIAHADYASGASAVIAIEGVFRLPKITGAITQGDKVDLDISAKAVGKGITPASGDIEDFGVALETAASGAATILVKLIPGVGALN
jgi:predicted RecA/RadA family phage recombinase